MHVQELPSDNQEIGVLDSRMQVTFKYTLQLKLAMYITIGQHMLLIRFTIMLYWEMTSWEPTKQLRACKTTPSEQFTPNQ